MNMKGKLPAQLAIMIWLLHHVPFKSNVLSWKSHFSHVQYCCNHFLHLRHSFSFVRWVIWHSFKCHGGQCLHSHWTSSPSFFQIYAFSFKIGFAFLSRIFSALEEITCLPPVCTRSPACLILCTEHNCLQHIYRVNFHFVCLHNAFINL